MWVKYKRLGKITLDNDTNNSVETLNGLLKSFIKSKTTLDKCLLGIFKLDDYLRTKYSFNDFNQRTKIIIDRSSQKDKQADVIYKLFTPYAAQIVNDSYGLTSKITYKIEYDGENVTLSSDKNSSIVSDYNSDKPSCNCFDFTCSLFPCRHILYIRKHHNLTIITRDMVHQRWLNRKFDNAQFQVLDDQVECLSYVNINSIVSKPNPNKPKSSKSDSNSRFNECKRIMNEIAQLVSGDSEDVFHDRMEQLLMIKEMWEKNINFTLKPIESSNFEDKVTPDDISTYNAIEINDDKSIDEPIS
ncbi:zinc finger SWIM domain-containing 3-like, partial [Brachionus plicatilis]